MAEPDDHHLDEYLDVVLTGGREARTVEIVEYRDDWPSRYLTECQRIAGALGETARRIEHIGSTAVPGLAAKPIGDILVTVDDPEDESMFRAQLEAAGYVLRVRESNHRMFRTPERDVHVHVWPSGGDEEGKHLLFRDRLRSSSDDRLRYEEAKKALAGHYRDGNYYAEAKSAVIEDILRVAAEGHTASDG